MEITLLLLLKLPPLCPSWPPYWLLNWGHHYERLKRWLGQAFLFYGGFPCISLWDESKHLKSRSVPPVTFLLRRSFCAHCVWQFCSEGSFVHIIVCDSLAPKVLLCTTAHRVWQFCFERTKSVLKKDVCKRYLDILKQEKRQKVSRKGRKQKNPLKISLAVAKSF